MTEKKVYTADFAAIEARVVAMLGHPVPPRQYHNPLLDIHTITTAIALQMPYSAVTSRLRSRVGKCLNFAALYTQGTQWSVPDKDSLLAIWTEGERHRLCVDLGVTQPGKLYDVLVTHFNITYRKPE